LLLRFGYLKPFRRYSRSKSDVAKNRPKFCMFWPLKFFRGGPPSCPTLAGNSSQIAITWQSFAAIGRGASEMWLPKKVKKNICGKTEARPELIVPGGLIKTRESCTISLLHTSVWQSEGVNANTDCQMLSDHQSRCHVVVEHTESRTAGTPYARFKFSDGKPSMVTTQLQKTILNFRNACRLARASACYCYLTTHLSPTSPAAEEPNLAMSGNNRFSAFSVA